MTRARVLLALLILASAAAMTWLAVYQVDDAFIVYRYARNLAHGSGFVFNPGERVEGVTCFLWTLALAPLSAVGLPLPRVAPVLTALCGLATIVVTTRRHADLEGRRALATRDLVPGLLLASMPAFLYWSVGALETVPFALLVALALKAHGQETSGASTSRRSSVWLALATLTRPEAPLVVFALGVDRWLAVRAHGGRSAGVREIARWLAPIAACFVPFVVFRRLYFGDWLPNTYYAKTGDALSLRCATGWDYLRDATAMLVPSFGAAPHLVAWIGLIVLLALSGYALTRPRLRAEGLVVVALAAACIVEGGDWMVFGRFFVPALPPLATLAGTALLGWAARSRIAYATATVLALSLLASGGLTAERARDGGEGLVVQREGYRHAHERVASELARLARPGDAVALMDVGMVGWFAPELRVIDITGLTDRDVAHASGGFLDKQFPVADLLARKPRFVVLVPGFGADERIHDDDAFRASYHPLFAVNHRFNWVPPNEYVLNVFERVGP